MLPGGTHRMADTPQAGDEGIGPRVSLIGSCAPSCSARAARVKRLQKRTLWCGNEKRNL